MTKDMRRRTLEALRRFAHGKCAGGELEDLARSSGARDIPDLLSSLEVTENEVIGAGIDLENLGLQIGLFLDGALSREEAHAWFELAHSFLSAASKACGTQATVPAILALLREVVAPGESAPTDALVRSLARMHECICDSPSRPARDVFPLFLEDALRAKARVELALLGSPEFLPETVRNQWADIGWRSAADGRVFLIPVCVLTRDYFRRCIPEVLSELRSRSSAAAPREDSFPYHPENDQAPLLEASFPSLTSSGPAFEYWIDSAGLVEVVLDVPRIGGDEILFATRLFCLRNGVRRARLDGRRISWAGVPSS